MKKLKIMLYSFLGLMAILGLIAFLFLQLSPQFGAKGKISKNAKKSTNFKDGLFHNAEETTVMLNFDWSSLGDYFKKGNKEPDFQLPVQQLGDKQLANFPDSLCRVTWFGHSALLLEIDGQKIFLDPMLGEHASPHPWLGPKRFNRTLPIAPENLPELDAVLFSHDHYDHLDYDTILKIKDKTKLFYVPLGLGEHLKSWGVQEEKILEFDWWEEGKLGNITLAATPARHFSGRGLTDRFTTLWCSWVIKSPTATVYFSGDSGYGKHFKQIGEKYGPFDIALMECGQYNEQWAQIHMMPEETVQAHLDLNAKVLLPIHWGAFKLALHDWTDPILRVKKEAEKLDVFVSTPAIGKPVVVNQQAPQKTWWNKQAKP